MAGKKTLKASWQEQLDRISQNAAQTRLSVTAAPTTLKVALVGVGSELNGDDAAGVQVARRINKATGMPAAFIAIDAGSIPENASGVLRKFKPDLVIIVDAAALGEKPGTISWLDPEMIDGMSASSHTLPLSVLGGYLEQELGCRVAYLGIQPEQLEFAAELTSSVEDAVDEIVRGFIDKFTLEK
jgi:hydrogenase 3 maturation protease